MTDAEMKFDRTATWRVSVRQKGSDVTVAVYRNGSYSSGMELTPEQAREFARLLVDCANGASA